MSEPRAWIKCAGCPTLWKSPTPVDHLDWDGNDNHFPRPCPVCGGTIIDLERTRISKDLADDMMALMEAAKQQQREMFGDVIW